MNLKYYYWYFESALRPRLCDQILELGKSKKKEIAHTGAVNSVITGAGVDQKKLKNLQKIRNSKVTWLDEPWIWREVIPYAEEANKQAGWNFQWEVSEPAQFTRYDVGQHYEWHCDSFLEPYNRPDTNLHGKIRKLSMTISLSDPSEYEGGNLEFCMQNDLDPRENRKKAMRECTEIRPRGSIVIFPSFVYHRVKPVTKGCRYSLVVWNCGQPWK